MSEQPSNPSELQVSRNKEPIFREYVYSILDQGKYLSEKELVNSGAEVADISPVTAKRYLEKMCSGEGKCESYINESYQYKIRYKRQDPSVSTTEIIS